MSDVLRGRHRHYLFYFAVFLTLYSILAAVGVSGQVWFLFVLIALAKDTVDEFLLRIIGQPLAYRRIEHAPSNVVILLFLLTGAATVPGTVELPALGTVGLTAVTVGLAAVDTAWDLWQDART